MPIWQPTQAIARPVYYDREQASVAQGFDVLTGQHAATVRSAYAVPEGRSAFIETIWGLIIRVGVPSVPDFYVITFTFTPYGGSAITIEQLAATGATLQTIGPHSTTQFGYMAAGDVFRATTEDDSTGGQAFYRGSFKGIEFTK